MNFKALLLLAMILASIILISAEVNPKDDKIEIDGVDESKYGYGGRSGGYGGYGRGGYGDYGHGGYGRGGYSGWHGGYGHRRGGWGGGYGGRGGYSGGRGWGGGWPAEYDEARDDQYHP